MRQSTPPSDGIQPGYLFIDNARFLSMIAILMRHCELSLYDTSPGPLLESAIVQFRTFGVQLFFVVSAFLMADWLARCDGDIREYWRTRWRQVAIPWLLWVGVYIALDLVRFYTQPHKLPIGLAEEIFGAIFYQSFWYVPILFFSLAIVLAMRRYWRSLGFGLALLLLSLIYGVNQYARWFPPAHTIALFGYLFPVWVGVQLFHNFRRVSSWVHRLPWPSVFALFWLAFGLTLLEDRVMENLGFSDTYNALQISNQVYSFVVLLALIKLRVNLVPAFIDVRKDSYGIYLSHQIVAEVGRGGINSIAGRGGSEGSFFVQLPSLVQDPLARIGLWMVWSALVYCVSLWVTQALRSSRAAWIVGVKPPRA